MTRALAALGATGPLEPISIERREVGPDDVRISIAYCGICHSDVHAARDEWGGTVYPVVPGHEIVGRVVDVGRDVTQHRAGDLVGVGCLVGSCGTCEDCTAGLESYCKEGVVFTYDSADPVGPAPRTYGGYSAEIVVTERFVLPIPVGLAPSAAGPVLCAGVTTYSPLRLHGAGPGTRVGIVGFGGLGNMAVKIANALGAEVTVVTRSPGKAEEARRAGADHVLVSGDEPGAEAIARSLDLVLSCIPTSHDLNPYLALLKRDGAYVVLGALERLAVPLDGRMIVASRLHVTGSFIGGLSETREVLDFCAERGIAPDVEVIEPDGVNEAFDRVASGQVGHRYVIDMASLHDGAGDRGRTS